jgi:hypothetical protein
VKGCHWIAWNGPSYRCAFPDDCSIEVQENLNLIPASLKWTGYGLFGFNLLVISICAAWIIRYRNTAEVRFSQPFFLMLVLLGCLISSSTIVAMAKESSDAACMAVPWLYSVGFCCTFGTYLPSSLVAGYPCARCQDTDMGLSPTHTRDIICQDSKSLSHLSTSRDTPNCVIRH